MLTDIYLRTRAQYTAKMADRYFNKVDIKHNPLTPIDKEYVKKGMEYLKISTECLTDDRCTLPEWAKNLARTNYQGALSTAHRLGC